MLISTCHGKLKNSQCQRLVEQRETSDSPDYGGRKDLQMAQRKRHQSKSRVDGVDSIDHLTFECCVEWRLDPLSRREDSIISTCF
jgi:hypothetical protein